MNNFRCPISFVFLAQFTEKWKLVWYPVLNSYPLIIDPYENFCMLRRSILHGSESFVKKDACEYEIYDSDDSKGSDGGLFSSLRAVLVSCARPEACNTVMRLPSKSPSASSSNMARKRIMIGHPVHSILPIPSSCYRKRSQIYTLLALTPSGINRS